MADAAQRAGATVAVAESLTAGALAQELAAAPNASSWFAGGIVAYRAESKFRRAVGQPGPGDVEAVCRGDGARST